MATIDHLGIAVKSIAAAQGLYEALGLEVVKEEQFAEEQLWIATIPLGESSLQLLEPTSGDSAVGKFLAERGEGLHHVAIHVDDISGTFESLRKRGLRLLDDDLQIGEGGSLYFRIDPAEAAGVQVEICQNSIADV